VNAIETDLKSFQLPVNLQVKFVQSGENEPISVTTTK